MATFPPWAPWALLRTPCALPCVPFHNVQGGCPPVKGRQHLALARVGWACCHFTELLFSWPCMQASRCAARMCPRPFVHGHKQDYHRRYAWPHDGVHGQACVMCMGPMMVCMGVHVWDLGTRIACDIHAHGSYFSCPLVNFCLCAVPCMHGI